MQHTKIVDISQHNTLLIHRHINFPTFPQLSVRRHALQTLRRLPLNMVSAVALNSLFNLASTTF